MKHKIYKNILARINVIYYSPGIRFETSLVKMDENKSLTNRNQLENSIGSNKYGSGEAVSSTYTLPQRITLWVFLVKRPKT